MQNEKTELRLLLNSMDITSTVANVNDTNDNDSVVIFQRTAENSITVLFANGISVVSTLSRGLLSFVVTTPAEFEGQAVGLLGNFNENMTDDLTYSNGTVLSIDAPDRDIHDFGQSCKWFSSALQETL